jgi:hypothetical protein
MQNEDKKPFSDRSRLTISPLNEDAVKEHLLETEPPARPLAPEAPQPIAPSNQATPDNPAPATPGVLPVGGQQVPDDFEWKPNTRLASRSKLLRNYGLALIILALIGAWVWLASGLGQLATSNPTLLTLIIVIYVIFGLMLATGIVLLTTKKKWLANTLLTVFFIVNLLYLALAVLSINIMSIILSLTALGAIIAVKRELKVLA